MLRPSSNPQKLRDTNSDGAADLVKTWGRDAGTGIALGGGFLYFGANATIYRWPWAAGQRNLYMKVTWRDLSGRRVGGDWSPTTMAPVRRVL